MKRGVFWLTWTLVALSLALLGIGTALSALPPASTGGRRFILWPLDPVNVSLLTYVAVGALIASHRPRNPIGWIFCAIGLRRWQAVVWLEALIIVAGYASELSEFRAGNLPVQFPALLNLLGFSSSSSLVSGLFLFATSGTLIIYCLGAIAIVLRFRRARGDERQQLKWFAYAALLAVAVVVVTQAFFVALQPLDPGALYPVDLFFGVPNALAFAAIPVAAGIAILKYRLYDIDLIIRRTLVYSLLTTLLALIYFGCIVVLQNTFGALTGQRESTLVTVLSTLVIAALFVPLRRRVQAFIDRRFYRSQYDAAHIVAQFGAGLRDEVNLEALSAHLLAAVDETMQPVTVSLWLRAARDEGRAQ